LKQFIRRLRGSGRYGRRYKMETATYSVVLNGTIRGGFDAETVTAAFAKMFKLPPEKAQSLVNMRFVIKKGVELPVAETYLHKLAEIGLEAELQCLGGEELSLAPLEDGISASAGSGAEGSRLPGSDTMVCPKCNHKQERAECCAQCGVYIHKVIQQTAEPRPAVAPAAVTAAVEAGGSAAPPAGLKLRRQKKGPAKKSGLFAAIAIGGIALAALGYLLASKLLA
jgi:hypothetical protein